MRCLLAVGLVFTLTGCAASLSERAKYISVISDGGVIASMNCTYLGATKGASSIWGGQVGLNEAMTELKNNAAMYPNATSVLITSSKVNPFSEIYAKVFNCSESKPTRLEIVSKPKKQIQRTDGVFVKAQKCQKKGGVWVNDSCVISIE